MASPVLSNIYLDRLDQFVEQHLIPEYTRGERRRESAAYTRIKARIESARYREEWEELRRLRRERRTIPSGDPTDPGYRRLRYVRYADDFLLGFAGPKQEAEEIRDRIREFLRDELALELSASKTLITHAVSQAARFLGYEIRTQMANDRLTRGQRAANSHLALFVPRDVIRKRCALYMRKGKPAGRGWLTRDEDYSIVAKYGAEYRGMVQYYLLAQDVFRLKRLEWVMIVSMLKTLASKHRSSVAAMARKHKAVADTPEGPRRCFEAKVLRSGRKPLVARLGGIPLKRRRTAVLIDRRPVLATRKNELVRQLLAEKCELCDARSGLHVHHVRKLADLDKPGRPEKPEWAKLMARRQRKTLVVCRTCHQNIHAGRITASARKMPLESGMR